MQLQVVAFGKLKTPGLREAADYYSKLIRPWVTLEEIELKPISVPDKFPATRSQIQSKEAQILTERLGIGQKSRRHALYLLDEDGRGHTTESWAGLVRQWEGESIAQVSLCVGSSLGFSDDLRSKAKGILSLGPQTLPHELARVVLLEQLYRAWSVTRGHPYHVSL